jgi:uncharacterized OB-fold protein
MSLPLLKPTLYESRADGSAVLKGGCCECGYVFFPMQHFGCERCGRSGESLKPLALSGRGRLVTSSLVNMHADAKREAPFVVGTIALDEGPVVRTLLTAKSEPVVGAAPLRVFAMLVPVKAVDEDGEFLDLRFQIEDAHA